MKVINTTRSADIDSGMACCSMHCNCWPMPTLQYTPKSTYTHFNYKINSYYITKLHEGNKHGDAIASVIVERRHCIIGLMGKLLCSKWEYKQMFQSDIFFQSRKLCEASNVSNHIREKDKWLSLKRRRFHFSCSGLTYI